jgi:hypothetical protein
MCTAGAATTTNCCDGKTMQNFHPGARGNNPWMAALPKTFPDADIDATVRYRGSL